MRYRSWKMSVLFEYRMLLALWKLVVIVGVASAAPKADVNLPDMDEILARAGDMQDAKNPQAAFPASGRRILGGSAELDEYDIVRLLPTPAAGTGGPDEPPRQEKRKKRSAVGSSSQYWPDARVPYDFASNMRAESISLIKEAMEEYHRLSCIRWVPKTSRDSSYVHFQDDSYNGGCWSYVGKTGGKQPLNLRQPSSNSFGCIYLRTAVHEMLHALGVYHQQSRTDRDNYVRINYENIRDGREHNFQIRTNTNHYNVPYDYRSVMHYGRTTFSTNGRLDTISTVDPAYQTVIGRSPTLSFQDVHLLNKIYECSSKGTCPSTTCRNGGFQGEDCNCYCASEDYTNPIEKCVSSTTSMICDAINKYCKCLDNSDCNNLANSYCSYTSGVCVCRDGYQAENGQCVIKPTSPQCDQIDKQCDCASRGSGACSGLPNSYCDTYSGACKCRENYYSNSGYCVEPPACTILNYDCKCHVQGANACSRIANSICDSQTGACKCHSASMEQVGACNSGGNYISDGSTGSPFQADNYCSVDWTPTYGEDNPSVQYPVRSNSYYLLASGRAGDCAQMETDFITPSASSAALCVRAGVDLDNAQLAVYYMTDYSTSWRSISVKRHLGYFYNWSIKINTNQRMKFEIKARGVSDGSWSVRLDPVVVGDCSADNIQYSVEASI